MDFAKYYQSQAREEGLPVFKARHQLHNFQSQALAQWICLGRASSFYSS